MDPESTEGLRDRLRLYARYAALVAEELEARERGDRERLRERMDERERVRAEIAALPGADGGDEAPAPGGALEAAVAEAERRAQAEAEVRDRLSRMRDASLRARSGVRLPRPAGDGYAPPATVRGALDVRR